MSDANNQPAGRGDYVVREGDCIGSIAEQFGFFWESIWNHSDNSELSRVRADPMVLLAGDRVTVPEIQPKEDSIATEKRHRFRRRGIPAMLRLRFLDEDEPRANVRCVVTIDAQPPQALKTDGAGVLEMAIAPDARKGTIQVGDVDEEIVYEIRLGYLAPHESIKGVQQRLRNLGVLDAEPDGVFGPSTADAVRAFRAMYDLEESAEIDAPLCDKLKELNGS